MATPFPNFSSGSEDDYIFFHSQVRIRVECAFGILVLRWGILRSAIQCNIIIVRSIALVSCLARLHNFCIDVSKRQWKLQYTGKEWETPSDPKRSPARLAKWIKQIGDYRQHQTDRSNKRENNKRVDYDYKVGDKVLIRKDDILCNTESIWKKKPWTITTVHTNGTIRIQCGTKSEISNIRRVTPFSEELLI